MHDKYCTGYISEPNQQYITGVILSVAKVKRTFEHHGSKILDYICAFDKAEAAGTYIGQVNMVYVSSFCSPDSFLWGYNLARAKDVFSEHHLVGQKFIENNGAKINIYSAVPLENALQSLFGISQSRKFPLYPGTHVPVAGRNIELVGPANLYAAIGIGIADDPMSPFTFMEDIGEIPLIISGGSLEEYKSKILCDIAKSVLTIGIEQGVIFKNVFVDIKHISINDDEVGSSLVAVPYFNLAKGAIPNGGFEKLKNMSLEEWKQRII